MALLAMAFVAHIGDLASRWKAATSTGPQLRRISFIVPNRRAGLCAVDENQTPLLDTIASPDDLRRLLKNHLQRLSDELRRETTTRF